MSLVRQPVIFVPHGGGPCFWMPPPPGFGPHAYDKLRTYLAELVSTLPEPPKAFVVVSAHWEAPEVTVSTCPAPPMLFDYYGFPPHTYELDYPASGDPALALEVCTILRDAGIPCGEDDERGFDHGVFVPFLIIDPEARIPVVMLSLRQGLDPAEHLAIGGALEPLRDQGVVIVGSGMSYHNLRDFYSPEGASSRVFDDWLRDAVVATAAEQRNQALIHWQRAPQARNCHPREEHLLPLMVVAGAAGEDKGRLSFHDTLGGKVISGFTFGNTD